MSNSKFKIKKAKEEADRGDARPTISELLEVIREYNRAHELDLQELNTGAVPAGKNEFLEDLYFAAAGAARALRPIMQVELSTVARVEGRGSRVEEGEHRTANSQQPTSSRMGRTPRIIPQTLGSVGQSPTAENGASQHQRPTTDDEGKR